MAKKSSAAPPAPPKKGAAAALSDYALPVPTGALLAETSIAYHPASDRRLVLVVASDQAALDSLLLRASIYYEHPTHRAKFLDELSFAGAQAAQKKRFVYYGHNMPLSSLASFLTAAANARSPLTPGESHLARALASPKLKAFPNGARQIAPVVADAYLVGLVRGDVATLQHEMQHAWFHFDAAGYRSACTDALASLDTMMRLQVRAYLQGCGYCEAVWVDEFQAHLCCGDAMPQVELTRGLKG
ncbi:hypothetical protein BC828DRAFT_407109 [Blastocladiella britannica]|nr:hypothetical protein BC828DRAFT_407109 [Blastocladiella britannica]